MKIATRKGVWCVTAMVTGFACLVVAVTIMLVYEQTEWPFELAISLGLTVVIATPVTHFMARQLRKNFLLGQALQHLVDHDRLTDLTTRTYFFDQFERDPTASGVVLMADIDHFKRINDTHGHLAGDRVIAGIAAILKKAVAPGDIVSRFGGEEFLVFLSGADPEAAQKAANRMRANAAGLNFEGDAAGLNVTISIGGARKRPQTPIKDAIRQADLALYRAKDAGRDRVVFGGAEFKDVA